MQEHSDSRPALLRSTTSMKSSPGASATHPQLTPSDRKRKRPGRQSSPEDTSRQQTLHSLFAGQQKPQASAVPAASPSSKRPRPAPRPTPPRALGRGEMYAFASRSPASNTGVVDLTHDNGTPSPQARRMPNAAVLRNRNGINPHTGAKKLVVKNLKTGAGFDRKQYLEKIWEQLDAALAIIFTDGKQGFSREELYRGVENVCRQEGASTLFSRLEGRCRTHVERDLRQPLLEKSGAGSVEVLRTSLELWKKWKEQMDVIRQIFYFLDRSYLLPSSKPTLHELTPMLFREIVFSRPEIKARIVDGACDLVSAERKNQSALDKTLFMQAVDMFHELQVYTASFEPRFLCYTQEFVAEWSDEMIVEKSVPEYVAVAEDFIAKEMARCEEFALDASTKRDLLALLEDHLVVRKTDLTEYEALAPLLDNGDLANLTALYGLLDRRRLGSNLRPAFEKWVDETGTEIVFGKEEDMVIKLLSLKRRLDLTWKSAFKRDESLGHGLRESFDKFMNKTKKGEATWGTDNTKIGEMIAKYVNVILRGGAKAIPEMLTTRRTSSITGPPAGGVQLPSLAQASSNIEEDAAADEASMDEDTEMNSQLDQVLDLFRFVHGKAVFEAFYKKDLARRLLMSRSASADAERSMLTRLKTECGSGFTQNLEQMFKDVELAREEMQAYRQRLEDRVGYEKGKGVELSVNILSAAAWPTYPDVNVVVPSEVQRAIEDFEMHYKTKHTGRKLDWKHALAHCQMRAEFPKGSKELVVSAFQAVVLLLFNGVADGETLTYQHILTETGLRKCQTCLQML